MIKISDRLFSFPPHLVTTWEHIHSLEGKYQDNDNVTLTFHMNTGLYVELPALPKSTVDAIFVAFQNFHEHRHTIRLKLKNVLASSAMNFPLPEGPHLGMGLNMGLNMGMTTGMNLGIAVPLSMVSPLANPSSSLVPLVQNLRHNPELKDLPSLPSDLLEKIAHTARELYSQDPDLEMPTPIAGCHCMHCQLARAVQTGAEQAGEPVNEQELRFSNWHVHPLGASLYYVVSTMDPSQSFEVQLKPEITCSCQASACVHIEAVLRS